MNLQHLNDIDGLKFMPVRDNKMPIVKGWQASSDKHDLSNCIGVGLVCGRLSGGLEVIDVDAKYDLTGKLFETYKQKIHDVDNKLLEKLLVQKTKGNGYHLIYRCDVIAGNLKLANRPTTDEEKNKTYQETYAAALLDPKNKSDDEARLKAEKAKINDKVRVLFETRGEGGYIMCYPSKGYEFINRDFYGISHLTIEERELLHTIARQFNQVVEEYVPPKLTTNYKKTKGISSFDDYNERGDVVGLLENNGWKVVGNKGNKTIFLRPGQTTSQTSGNYDHNKKWFSVFSTSTEFEPEHAYQPYAVFAVLECDKDFSAASKKLYELGYGDRYEESKEKEKAPSTRVIPSRINPDDNDLSFLAKSDDYIPFLNSVMDGTLEMGKTTGVPSLDVYFLFKHGNVVSINGIDNTGKTKFVLFLLLIAAMLHNWRGIIYCSENTVGSFMRTMIQFYWGKQLKTGSFQMSESEYLIAKTFVENHFCIIKTEESLYNYKDILNMIKKVTKQQKFDYAMIDPYNSLKIDLSGFSKLSTHEFHSEALSEIKAYSQANDFGFFINHHAYTAASRAKDGEKKYPKAPGKEDTASGMIVPAKSDEFLTVHRLTQHPTDWMITDVYVRKVKENETGGRASPMDFPIRFEMYKGGTAFIEKNEDSTYGVDPIAKWHNQNGTQQEMPLSQVEVPKVIPNMWMPFRDNDGEIPEF